MKLKPLGGHVIVESSAKEVTTASGIIIPGTAEKGAERGTVVAIGPGKFLESGHRQPIEVSLGDQVIFRYGVTEFKEGGVTQHVVSVDEIVAVIQE